MNSNSNNSNNNKHNENIATPEKTAKLAEKYTQYSYIEIEKMLLDNNGSLTKTVNALKKHSLSSGGLRKTRRRSRKMMK